VDAVSTGHADPLQRTASQPVDAALQELPFPRYQIALVQDESEMILQPAYDLFPFIGDEADQRWDVELFTERTFEALLAADEQFDCIVIGLNAASKSRIVRDALSARLPHSGLCVLHQRRRGDVPFLVGDVGLDIAEFRKPVAPVTVAEKVEAKDEILLNYPKEISLARDPNDADEAAQNLVGAEAFCGLTPSPTSEWRTVLEVHHGRRRVPVLVRTRSGRNGPPVVVCTVLLQPRDETHRLVLGNILAWCVSGRPEALIVGDEASADDARLVHRKLRMQGTRAVAGQVSQKDDLDFSKWPFRGIADIVLPAAVDPTAVESWPASDPAHVRTWLRRGGRIIRLGPGEQLTMTHGESDAHWVTRRWALWFLSEPAARWHGGTVEGRSYDGSVIGSRAVLRFLAALHDRGKPSGPRQPGSVAVGHVFEQLAAEGSSIDPDSFGLHRPSNFLPPVARLLRARHPRSAASVQHVDYSVSATCAYLDINSLLDDQALDATTIAALEAWLRRQFNEVGLEERFEIARCLADVDLLDDALGILGRRLAARRPLTAALETKLREVVVACSVLPDAVRWPDAGYPSVVERGLRLSPLLSANYLVALGDLEVHWRPFADKRHGLATPAPQMVDRAVIGIGRHGTLLPEETTDGRLPHEMLSTTALALFAYFGRHMIPTHVIRPESQGIAPQLITSVLNEAERLRQENAEVHSQARTIEIASHVIGAVALVPILAVAVLVWWVGKNQAVAFLPLVGLVIAGLGFAFLGASAMLDRLHLCPAWLRWLTNRVDENISGIKNRWRKRVADRNAPPDAGA
jgi:hypothetical protein